MRRSIAVFGATLDDGSEVTTNDEGIVTVRVHPDNSVSTIDSNNDESVVEGKNWVSYVPRFN